MIEGDQVSELSELISIISIWSSTFSKIASDAVKTLQNLPVSNKLNIRELQRAAVSMSVGITDIIQKFQHTKITCESTHKEFINPPWNSPGC
mgnify:CR=1 FL=1